MAFFANVPWFGISSIWVSPVLRTSLSQLRAMASWGLLAWNLTLPGLSCFLKTWCKPPMIPGTLAVFAACRTRTVWMALPVLTEGSRYSLWPRSPNLEWPLGTLAANHITPEPWSRDRRVPLFSPLDSVCNSASVLNGAAYTWIVLSWWTISRTSCIDTPRRWITM